MGDHVENKHAVHVITADEVPDELPEAFATQGGIEDGEHV